MKQNTKDLGTILVAAPPELANPLSQVLRERGFSVLVAPSLNDAIASIEDQKFQAIVMISDWAIKLEQPSHLMEIAKGKIPTVALISKHTWQHYREHWFNELFHPPSHEYCSLPADVEEVINRINKVTQTLKTSKNIP